MRSSGSQVAHQAGAYPGGLFPIPPGRDAIPSQGLIPPALRAPVLILYTWPERDTARVKCPSQDHNTMSLARVWTLTARSGDKRTNREATSPPTICWLGINWKQSKLSRKKQNHVELIISDLNLSYTMYEHLLTSLNTKTDNKQNHIHSFTITRYLFVLITWKYKQDLGNGRISINTH